MSDKQANISARLDELAEEFADLDKRERLELLLDFSDRLPPLPERFEAQRDAGEHRVHECQTEVYLWVELDDGKVQVYADVAPEAPTVKGFVGILAEAFSGATPDEVLSVKSDLLQRFGLIEALGMVRMRGLSAILQRIRREVLTAQESQMRGEA